MRFSDERIVRALQWAVIGLVGALVGVLVSACSAPVDPGGGPNGQGASQNETHDVGGAEPTPDSGVGGSASRGPVADAGADASKTDGGGDATVPPGMPGPWSSVSVGITKMDTGVGDNILVVYGGYTATDHDSQAWATELWSARLGQLGVGHLYAARGPEDAGYAAREIGNSALATQLALRAGAASSIIVVAHSSGAFVADELFTFASPAVLAKLAYFDLDGGSWALTNALVGAMKGVTFCNAHDAVAGDSHNADSIVTLHADFPASHFFTVDADGSGCNVGATWCLHDTLIINRPHDPTTFDLDADYTTFTSGRHVITSYIDHAVSAGVL